MHIFRSISLFQWVSLSSEQVVDNWRFAPATKTWSRLRDLPTSGSVFGGAGGGDSTFEDRYILLLGAYQYGQVFTSIRQSGSNSTYSDRHYRAGELRTMRLMSSVSLSLEKPNK